MGAGGEPGHPQRAEEAAAFLDTPELTVLLAICVVDYAVLQVGGPGLPDSVKIGVPFLLLPVFFRRRWGKPWAFGKLDLTLLLSAAVYAPFAVVAAFAAGGSPWYYAPLAANVVTAGAALWFVIDTFFHVGAVDYFTKAVVQREAEPRFGRWNALYLQLVAWTAGHGVEWLWLRLILGDAGAAVYLVAAGVVTGLAYMRWKNVLGLMLGHLLVNVAAALAAVSLYG